MKKRTMRIVACLLFAMFSTITASAQEYITDVMLIGAKTETEYNNLKTQYTGEGWKVIDYDLNKGIPWGSGHGILLLYKSAGSYDGFNHGFITDFYLQNRSVHNTEETLDFNGRTYYIVPFAGDINFRNQWGDLNTGTGADTEPIHLYYTKETFADNRVVSAITFNDQESGAVGCEGWLKDGFDLNAGCSKLTSQEIYMHLTTSNLQVEGEFISALQLIGAPTESELNTYKNKYTSQGWKVIDHDLNKGINWGDGDGIYLLYKTENCTDGQKHNFVTNFYIETKPYEKLENPMTFRNQKFSLVPYDGSSHFREMKGDLNSGTGSKSASIHLYYTTDQLDNSDHAVYDIYFNSNKYGAVPQSYYDGLGYDLNSGCSNLTSQEIYLHFNRKTTHIQPATQSELEDYSTYSRGCQIKGWAFNMDKPGEQLAMRVEVRTADGTLYREDKFTTDVMREDINEKYGLTGAHGFRHYINEHEAPAGTYKVKIFANNLIKEDVQVGEEKTFTIVRTNPNGTIDGQEQQERSFKVWGWAYDPDEPDQQIPIRIEVKKADGSSLKTVQVKTDVFREDVNKAKGITGDHGFSTTVDMKEAPAGTYTVTLIACDVSYDSDVQIGNPFNVTIVRTQPQSALDLYETYVSSFKIQGWAYDPEAPTESLPIRVEVYDSEGKPYKTVNLTTDVLRTDVNTAKGISGNHGFSAIIDLSEALSSTYTVKIFAEDLTGDGEVQISGTKTLVITRNKPLSELELVDITDEGILVKGWAYDPDKADQSVDIRIEIKKADGKITKKSLTTDVVREDVNKTKDITGTHGFEVFFEMTHGTYTVDIFASDLTGDGEVQVGETKKGTVFYDVVLTETDTEFWLLDGYRATGTGGDNSRIRIKEGATVMLNGVSLISAFSKSELIFNSVDEFIDYPYYRWPGITCSGDATIILADDSENIIQGGGAYYPAIEPGPAGTTLTICGNGKLTALGWAHAAAIGSRAYGNCGDIVIDGGDIIANTNCKFTQLFNDKVIQVTATGSGAAIGSGTKATCGDITITDNIIRVEAVNSDGRSEHIGAGMDGQCGTITIGANLTDETNDNVRILQSQPLPDNGPTDINTIFPSLPTQNNAWYTIDGRRLNSQPHTQGLYINNGKKILVR